jgi:putative ABC transport system permease protein
MTGLLAAVPLTTLAGARRTASAYDRFRGQTRGRDVTVQVEDPALLGRFRDVLALDGVAAGAEVALFPAFSDLERGFDLGIVASRGNVYGVQLDRPRILDGRMPRPDRADEVLLNETAATQLRVQVGDTFALGTFSPEQLQRIDEAFSGRLEGPRLLLRVAGVGRLPEDLHGDEASLNVIATPAFYEQQEGRAGRYTGLAGFRLHGGTGSAGAFERRVRRVFGAGAALQVTSAGEDSQQVRDATRVLTLGLTVIGLAAALVTTVAMGQALSRQLWAGAEDQPALAALGMTRPERALGNVFVALPVALVAALVAGVAALGASPLLPIDIARRAEPDPGVAFDALVLGVGVPVLAALVLATAGLSGWRLAGPRLLETDAGGRSSFPARLAARLRLPVSALVGIRMALAPGTGGRSVPARTAFAGAVLGLAGIVGVLTFDAGLDRLVHSPPRYGANYDVTPDLNEKQDVQRAVALADVGDAGLVHHARVEIERRSAQGYSMTTLKGVPHFSLVAGHEPTNDHEVALGPDQLRRHGLGLGDRVSLARPGTTPREFVAVGRVLVPGFSDDPFADGVVLTPAALDGVRQNEGSERLVLNWRQGVKPSDGLRRLRRALPDAVSAYSRPRPPAEVANLARVDDFPRVLGTFLVVLALATTAHALVTSVRRRRRDLAVLRCIGFVRAQLFATVSWHSLTLVIVALVLGLPLGIGLGRWTWTIVADQIGVATDALTPAVAFTVVVPAALAAACVLAAGPAWLAARRRAASVLRAE